MPPIYLPILGPVFAVLCGLMGVITGMLSFLALFMPLPFLGFKTRERAAIVWVVSVFLVFASWFVFVWKTYG